MAAIHPVIELLRKLRISLSLGLIDIQKGLLQTSIASYNNPFHEVKLLIKLLLRFQLVVHGYLL